MLNNTFLKNWSEWLMRRDYSFAMHSRAFVWIIFTNFWYAHPHCGWHIKFLQKIHPYLSISITPQPDNHWSSQYAFTLYTLNSLECIRIRGNVIQNVFTRNIQIKTNTLMNRKWISTGKRKSVFGAEPQRVERGWVRDPIQIFWKKCYVLLKW